MNAIYPHYTKPGVYIFEWESDASGNATVTSPIRFNGYLHGIKFIPGDGVTDGYDAQLTDDEGVNLLGNADTAPGTNLPSDASDLGNYKQPLNANMGHIFLFNTTLTLAISGAGANKTGKIYIATDK